MKCVSLFLMLSLVVLMAEPGDAFIHHIFKGLFNVGKSIYRAVKHRRWGDQQQQDQQDQQDLRDQQDLQDLQDQQQQQQQEQQEQMDRRFFNRERAAFD
ncbi:moronecidin-like [Amphiprion ocellaris]|uniref:moronecidin-like n=1 Tax=Amphiprion ocellaris TaxID=80972 RepID=UPI002410BB0F|nr:moronecidin-like [Amphiprion ocellaris]